MRHRLLIIALIGTMTAREALALDVSTPRVERIAPDKVVVRWSATGPIDVFMADRADAPIAEARLVSDNDRDGTFVAEDANGARHYFILTNQAHTDATRVAERALPLERGSNFRDLGGYPTADGKHVRWGKIYRSGATAMLSDRDVAAIDRLGIKSMIDLRSIEERKLAPTRLTGDPAMRYIASDYSLMPLLTRNAAATSQPTAAKRAENGYVSYLPMLAPQYKAIFDELLGAKGAVSYNCAAGQDRTGMATALVLSALGVPRATILEDYHLSTVYRHPEFETPPIDAATAASDPVYGYFAKMQQSPGWKTPRPLYTSAGTSQLAEALDAIDARWGSVENYLAVGLGIGKPEIARLRALYLE